jgi:mannose-1-phosphate guanylyltransferase/phosphomannomutase
MIKQAIIIAGGFGTRLRPYTDTTPKPMLPVLGKPLLDWNIEQFKKFGVTEFFLTLHHMPDAITKYFGDGSKFGVKMHYFIEDTPLGTAGGIKKMEPLLDEEFFVMNGDTLSLIDYGAMEKAWRGKRDAIGMQRIGTSSNYGDADVAELDADGRIIAIHPKPHDKNENVYRMRGIYILKKEILAYASASDRCELNTDLLPRAIAAGKSFYGYECDDYSKGIDTVEKWKEVEGYLKDKGF